MTKLQVNYSVNELVHIFNVIFESLLNIMIYFVHTGLFIVGKYGYVSCFPRLDFY